MSTEEMQEIHTLRQRVHALEMQVEFLYKQFNLTYEAAPQATDDPRVVAALRAHNTVEAIRFYREAHNAGLAEAKSAVEEIAARLGIR